MDTKRRERERRRNIVEVLNLVRFEAREFGHLETSQLFGTLEGKHNARKKIEKERRMIVGKKKRFESWIGICGGGSEWVRNVPFLRSVRHAPDAPTPAANGERER